MEDLYDPEEKILCPYNKSHHIRRCRMSFHLVKCKQSHGEQKMVPCDFNATHMIAEPELQYHHQICSDRRKIEARIVESRARTENKYPIPNIQVAADENWDDNCFPTYDPKKYAETHDVLRHIDVVSESKRKNFRMEERVRLSELSRQNQNETPETSHTIVNLPQHPPVTHVDEGKTSRSKLREKLKLGQNRVYQNYTHQPPADK